ncbi:MAG: hypothetical protein OXE02_11105 [Chloroflexi bacterium]|nr:hypothetical protein [Chloroflexota bacterium]
MTNEPSVRYSLVGILIAYGALVVQVLLCYEAMRAGTAQAQAQQAQHNETMGILREIAVSGASPSQS